MGESKKISAQNRPLTLFGRKWLHVEVLQNKWWARTDSNRGPPACELSKQPSNEWCRIALMLFEPK